MPKPRRPIAPPGGGRRRLLITCVLVAAGGTGLLAFVTRDDVVATQRKEKMIGPNGGTVRLRELEVRIPPLAFRVPTAVSIEVPSSRDATEYDSVSEPRTPMFRVRASRTPARPAELRFSLTATANSHRLVAATRNNPDEPWGLAPGRGSPGQFVVRTLHFSDWSVLELPKLASSVDDSLAALKRTFERAVGVRADSPFCSDSPPDVEVAVDDADPGDPLLRACGDVVDGGAGVRVASNRAIGLEFDPPEGIRVEGVEGGSLSEAIWDAINRSVPGVGGRILPGGGRLLLLGGQPKDRLRFRPTTQALVFDVMAVAVAGTDGSALQDGGEAAEFAGCVWRVAGAAGGLASRGAFAGVVRDAWAQCAKYLPSRALVLGGLFLGGIQMAYGVFDAFDSLRGRSAVVRLSTRLDASDLLSVPVPSLCEHPAGRLVDGSLPGIPEHDGIVQLGVRVRPTRQEDLVAFGDLTGDGVSDAAAVIVCHRGGVAWGDSVQLYKSDLSRLGGVTLTDISREQGRDAVYEIAIRDARVAVKWTANRNSDSGCCPTLDWSARLGLAGRELLISDVRSYDETLAAQRILDAVRRGDRSRALDLADTEAVQALFSTHDDAALRGFACHGNTVVDTWPADATSYWQDWPPPADEDDPRAYGTRYCLVDLEGVDVPAILGMEHVGYRRWRAVSFTAPGFGSD